MHLLMNRSTVKRANKRHNLLKYNTQKTFISLCQAYMILGYMVRAVHLRALVHLCVLRSNAARASAAQFDDF